MDWITILKAQQTDFIQRLKSGQLLHCETEGQHSELTIISGERLKQLRDFCWEMAEKYRHTSSTPIRNVFINNLKGKLGEEVVKARLADFVTEVDYEKRISGDGKVDFTLTSDASVGIQVKARHGSFDKIKWTISQKEIEKNVVLVCILIQEEVSEAQTKYNLILAGFLATDMIKSAGSKASVGINELLYIGGLRGYLDSLIADKVEEYIRLGTECFYGADDKGFTSNFNQALQLNPNNSEIYYERGIIFWDIGFFLNAIADLTQAIKLNPNNANYYYNRGLIRRDYAIISEFYYEDINIIIDDFSQAIKLEPYEKAYYERGCCYSFIGEFQTAIEDLNQAIKFNSNKTNDFYADCYYELGRIRFKTGDKQGSIKDFQTAADMYREKGRNVLSKRAMEQIKQIKSTLDN